jgi:methylmalonyl-CoA/ethylmalonyl-CoA epimerase
MEIINIGQVAIKVKNYERAYQFYKNVLELEELYRFGELSFFKCGNTRIFLSPENNNSNCNSSIIYFKVDDIQTSYKKLLNMKVELIDTPHVIAKVEDKENWMVFFFDSEGNTLALMSEKPISTSLKENKK